MFIYNICNLEFKIKYLILDLYSKLDTKLKCHNLT